MTIRDRLKAIRQAEEANIASINRYLERGDAESVKALNRREAKIEKMLKEVTKEIIDQEGQL